MYEVDRGYEVGDVVLCVFPGPGTEVGNRVGDSGTVKAFSKCGVFIHLVEDEATQVGGHSAWRFVKAEAYEPR